MINKKMGISEIISTYKVWAFFALTIVVGLIVSEVIYGLRLDIYGSGLGIGLYLLYMLCPLFVAILLLAAFDGRDGVFGLFGSMLRWKIGVQWYVLVLLLPVAIELLTAGAYVLIAGKLPEGYAFSLLPGAIMLSILISGIGLALGLGYALPLLLKTYSPAITTVIVALFMIAYRAIALLNDANALAQCIGIFALAYLVVWIYNSARNSLLPVALFLFLYSLLSNLITYQLAIYSASALPIYLNKALLIFISAAAVLLFRHFSLDEP